MNYQETYRRTGRTTRMIKDAVRVAVTGTPVLIVVRLVADEHLMRSTLVDLYGRLPPNVQVISWTTLMQSCSQERIPAFTLPDTYQGQALFYDRQALFYDHSVMETYCASILDKYLKYNEPNVKFVPRNGTP